MWTKNLVSHSKEWAEMLCEFMNLLLFGHGDSMHSNCFSFKIIAMKFSSKRFVSMDFFILLSVYTHLTEWLSIKLVEVSSDDDRCRSRKSSLRRGKQTIFILLSFLILYDNNNTINYGDRIKFILTVEWFYGIRFKYFLQVFSWMRIFPDWLNPFLHPWHTNGFSPVWMLK